MFHIGDTLQDKITGVKGIATGHIEWITGCDQWVLQPKPKKDERLPEQITFDENRLKLVKGKRIDLDEKPKEKKGGPTPYFRSSKNF